MLKYVGVWIFHFKKRMNSVFCLRSWNLEVGRCILYRMHVWSSGVRDWICTRSWSLDIARHHLSLILSKMLLIRSVCLCWIIFMLAIAFQKRWHVKNMFKHDKTMHMNMHSGPFYKKCIPFPHFKNLRIAYNMTRIASGATMKGGFISYDGDPKRGFRFSTVLTLEALEEFGRYCIVFGKKLMKFNTWFQFEGWSISKTTTGWSLYSLSKPPCGIYQLFWRPDAKKSVHQPSSLPKTMKSKKNKKLPKNLQKNLHSKNPSTRTIPTILITPLRNYRGDTAEDLAQAAGHSELLQLLATFSVWTRRQRGPRGWWVTPSKSFKFNIDPEKG